MDKAIHLLIVEDSENDAILIQRQLIKQGYRPIWKRVDTAETMKEFLRKQTPDIVISDYVLPSFGGLEALKLLQEVNPDIPCLITSGRIDEETAVAAMRSGAKDYIMKDNLQRLGPAVERELQDAKIRIERRKAEEALRQNETKQKTIERRILLSNEIMKLFWESSSKQDYAEKVVYLIQNWCKCDCVGLRTVNLEDDVIPYLAFKGFNDEFIKAESSLSLKRDQCACIRVINGKIEPQDNSALTPGGSFYLSNSREFADNLTKEELSRFRGVCIGNGFHTIVIVPISHHKTTLGAIHLTDKARSALSLKEIEALESIAPLIGQGFYRFDMEEKIRASETRLAEAQRIANLGNWDWNVKTGIFWWSDEIYHIFKGKPETLKPSYEVFLGLAHPDDKEFIEKSFQNAINNGTKLDIECRLLLPDGSVRVVHERGEVKYNDSGNPIHLIGTIQDITEHKELERQLLESSLHARSLIEASLDPLVTINAEGKIMDVNKATEIATGLSREKLIGADFANYFTQPERARDSYKKVFSEGYVRDYPLALRHVQGNITEVLYNATLYRNIKGEVQGVFAAARDITQLKRVEEELRALSHQIVDAQENERRSIARELHDEIGQSLTALKMLLAQAERLPSNERANNLCEAKTVISDLMQQVREMSLKLRPSMLDDLGLLPTLLWHFERFTTQTGIHIKFEHNGLPKPLPPEVNTAVYRVIQEALTNIARHAKVNTAIVDILCNDDELSIRIEDKGTGFAFSDLDVNSSTGLSGMRERVRLLGGKLSINSSPGRGTVVTVEMPISSIG